MQQILSRYTSPENEATVVLMEAETWPASTLVDDPDIAPALSWVAGPSLGEHLACASASDSGSDVLILIGEPDADPSGVVHIARRL